MPNQDQALVVWAREMLAAEVEKHNREWAESIRSGDGRVATGAEPYAIRAIVAALAAGEGGGEAELRDALMHARTFIENRHSDLSPEKRSTVAHINRALDAKPTTQAPS